MRKNDFDIQFFAEGGEGGGTDTGGSVTQQAGGSILTSTEGSVTQQATDQVVQQTAQAAEAQPPVPTTPQQVSQTPESYQPFTLPEGVQADPEQMQAASALFREMNLTQEQAQKLVDFHAKHWIGAVASYENELQRRVDEWGEQTKANPEFGGIRLAESLTSVRRAVAKLGGDELEKALNETGAINHPGIFGAFVRMGKLFGEDSFVAGQAAPGAGAANSPSDMAARVYPAMKRT